MTSRLAGQLVAVRAIVALAVLAEPAAAQADVTRTGRTFTVVLHPGKLGEALAARLADEALAAAEGVRPALEKLQLRPAKAPVIHVYAVDAEFRAVEVAHVKYSFRVESFVQSDESAAHVVLPALDAVDLGLVGLPAPTAHHVMLQAVQLAVFSRVSWVAIDPWRAGVVAHGVVDEILVPDGAMGVDPMFDHRRYQHGRRVAAGKPPTMRARIEAVDAPADRGAYDRQHETMGLVAETLGTAVPGWVRKLLATPDEKLRGMPAQRVAAIESILGKDWAKNEARFTKVLAKLPGRWYVTGPMVARRDGRLLLVGGETASTIFGFAPPPPVPYAIRATCELVKGRTQDLRVQVDWDEQSLLACFIQDDAIWIALWQSGAKDWKKLTTAKSPVVAGKPFALSVEVDTKLRVVIDGAQVLELDYGNRAMRGEWSVAKNIGPVWLTDLRCEPLAPPKK